MQKPMFKATEEFLGEAMKKQLLLPMAEAGKTEKDCVICNNQGVPYASIVAHGGWSKNSHKQ